MYNKNPGSIYSRLYSLCNKGARLQHKNINKAYAFFDKIDIEVKKLLKYGMKFRILCNGETYNLPLNINETPYFRPFFNMITHKKIKQVKADDTNAVDFDIPTGTKIYAVESGIITAAKTDSKKGGNNPIYSGDDNYFYIYNKSKNLMFCYRHFKPSNVLNKGSIVNKGDFIGEVGITGYVITPHLHFVIYEFNNNSKYILRSLPLVFC